MRPATAPRDPRSVRLLALDPEAGTATEHPFAALPGLLEPGDVLVVNDAATLPASLAGSWRGAPLEVRLAAARADGSWDAVLHGAGDWRDDTDRRPAPPPVPAGGRIAFAPDLAATISAVSSVSPRLVTLRFEGAADAAVAALYRLGRPVQYSYLSRPLELAQVQTPYATRPWAMEMPSAGRSLSWEVLRALRARRVAVETLTHAAGLSATGDPALDEALPLPERYDIPLRTVEAIASAHRAGARVVAVGTTAVRALEGSAATNGGAPRAGTGITDLRIGPGFEPLVVDGLLTGVHVPGTSHHRLLAGMTSPALLDRALARAEARGFQLHEFGDSLLVLGRPRDRSRRRAA